MRIQGVLFDFNGTLFLDAAMNEAAWEEFARRQGLPSFSKQEFSLRFNGLTTLATLQGILGGQHPTGVLLKYAEQKEELYRYFCRQHTDILHLTPGAEDLFTHLKQIGIPFGIATSAGWDNVSFFIEVFGLHRWFSPATIVYNDGTIPSKPAPDIYLKAAADIGCDIHQCLVFEDSPQGIEAGRRAGVAGICAIAPQQEHAKFRSLPSVVDTIENFTQFDRSFLLRPMKGIE